MMDFPLEHGSFQKRRVAVRPASLWKGARLLVDGKEFPPVRREYRIHDDQGCERRLVFKQVFLDPIPRVQIDGGDAIAVAQPLLWYEWVWMAFPLLLVVAGGALGGILGFTAMWASTKIFRSNRGLLSKYGLSALASASATILYLTLAGALQLALGTAR